MTPDRLAKLLTSPDPAVRELAARMGVEVCREVRAQALRELHAKLGSWQKVGDAVGVPRQDAWRMGTGRG